MVLLYQILVLNTKKMINIIKPNILKLILFFLVSPGRRYRRNEIKEFTELNNVILDEVISELINLKIIFKKNNLLKINLENKVVSDIKEEIENKEIVDLPLKIKYILVDVMTKIQKIKELENIILFGSYAKLIYHKNSDVDLALIFRKEVNKIIEKKINLSFRKISRKYGLKIEIHFFISEDLKNKKDPLVKEIVQNGRKLI